MNTNFAFADKFKTEFVTRMSTKIGDFDIFQFDTKMLLPQEHGRRKIDGPVRKNLHFAKDSSTSIVEFFIASDGSKCVAKTCNKNDHFYDFSSTENCLACLWAEASKTCEVHGGFENSFYQGMYWGKFDSDNRLVSLHNFSEGQKEGCSPTLVMDCLPDNTIRDQLNDATQSNEELFSKLEHILKLATNGRKLTFELMNKFRSKEAWLTFLVYGTPLYCYKNLENINSVKVLEALKRVEHFINLHSPWLNNLELMEFHGDVKFYSVFDTKDFGIAAPDGVCLIIKPDRFPVSFSKDGTKLLLNDRPVVANFALTPKVMQAAYLTIQLIELGRDDLRDRLWQNYFQLVGDKIDKNSTIWSFSLISEIYRAFVLMFITICRRKSYALTNEEHSLCVKNEAKYSDLILELSKKAVPELPHDFRFKHLGLV